MPKKTKLNNNEANILVEYRVALDIKNSVDKLVAQLKSEFANIVNGRNLVNAKSNYVFNYDRQTFVVAQSQRDILDQATVKTLLTEKKLSIPYKTSTSITIKNVSSSSLNVDTEIVKLLKGKKYA
tara:strand:+ start:81 stop:455 length:375 start_codon:yes stop_codon:yes gene_type:complete